jgi:hypothetical protein
VKRFKLKCVDRTNGSESVEVVRSEDQAEAFAAVAQRGKMVAKVLEIEDLPESQVPPSESEPSKPPLAKAWESGSCLASTGQTLVIAGLLFVPLAIVGCLLGAVAAEMSGGKRGTGVALAGSVIVVVWVLLLMFIALLHFL